MAVTDSYIQFTAEKPIFMRMAEVANFPQMSTEQQQIYMRSLNNYRTFLATKDYDYNLGHEEGVLNSARLMIAAGVDRTFVITTLKLTDHQIKGL